jgi:asparagine synthase (glutamine-hydrolysing)
MCGITGIYSSREPNKEVIGRKMTQRIAHRGPDAEGEFWDDEVYLGHRRLSIIDTSERANQPLSTEDGRYTIVFNGEIYNFKEIQKELDESDFFSTSDTEVILKAYRKWGKSFLNKLNGMFALAIWDKESKELLIARDRLGIKPLYFLRFEGEVFFSSEIRSLLESGRSRRKTNAARISEFLVHQTVYAPNTLIQDIFLLEAGSYMTCREGRVQQGRYWEAKVPSRGTVAEHARVKDLLAGAVQKRMISDVPLGAFLSGGIDSSAIVGLMAQHSESAIDTFSVTFEEETFSEKVYSDMIAKRFNTRHHEIRLKPEIFLDEMPDILNAIDHPSGDGPNTYVISKKVKEGGLTVALSGLGGDELFAGYDLFRNLRKLRDRGFVYAAPKGLRSLLANFIGNDSIEQKKMKAFLSSDGSLASLHDIYRASWMPDMIREMFEQNPYRWAEGKKNRGGKTFLSQVSELEIGTYMQHVLLRDTDQMSMAHALEVRVPFLDHELVEYTLSLEDDSKWPNSPKQLLTESMGDLLPREIIDRPKMGFTLPWEHWLKNELRETVREGFSALAERSSLFELDQLNRVQAQFEGGSKTYTWARVWLLTVLGHWMKQNGIETT